MILDRIVFVAQRIPDAVACHIVGEKGLLVPASNIAGYSLGKFNNIR